MWFILFGLFVGMVAPLQTAMNTRLRLAVGSPFGAGFYNFLVGASVLAALAFAVTGAAVPQAFSPAAHPWWMWLGGTLGMFVMVSNTLLFPRLGAMQTVVLANAGLVFAGLVIDHFGLFVLRAAPLSVPRLVGAVLVFAGVLAAVGFFSSFRPTPPARPRHSTPGASGRASSGDAPKVLASGPDRRKNGANPDIGNADGMGADGALRSLVSDWLWRGYGALAGATLAAQAAINGRLTVVLESPLRSAMVSFATGFALLAVIVLVTRTSLRPRPLAVSDGSGARSTHPRSTHPRNTSPLSTHGSSTATSGNGGTGAASDGSVGPWWMWVGGCLGALLVGTKALLVPEVGAGVTVVVTLAGMTAGSLIIDRFGWLGATKRKATPIQLVGVVAMLIGVALVQMN